MQIYLTSIRLKIECKLRRLMRGFSIQCQDNITQKKKKIERKKRQRFSTHDPSKIYDSCVQHNRSEINMNFYHSHFSSRVITEPPEDKTLPHQWSHGRSF